MAAAIPPPAERIEAIANCADPAKVVADITTDAVAPIPAASASTPKDIPNSTTATAKGAAARRPGP
jgi:hypothetical protein